MQPRSGLPAPRPRQERAGSCRSLSSLDRPCRSRSAEPFRRRRRRSSRRPRAGPAPPPFWPASPEPASSAGRCSSCSVLSCTGFLSGVFRSCLIPIEFDRRKPLTDGGDRRPGKRLEHRLNQRVAGDLVPHIPFATHFLLALGLLALCLVDRHQLTAYVPLVQQLAGAHG